MCVRVSVRVRRVFMVNAEIWLRNYLSDGLPHYIKDLREDARAVGLVKKDLREVRRKVGVVTEANYNPLTEETDWFWRLKGEIDNA